MPLRQRQRYVGNIKCHLPERMLRSKRVDLSRPKVPVRLYVLPAGKQNAQILIAVNTDIRISKRTKKRSQF